MAEPIKPTRLHWVLVTSEVVVGQWAEASQAAMTKIGEVRHFKVRFKQPALVPQERAFSSSYFNSNLVATASDFDRPKFELLRLPAEKNAVGSYYLRRVLITTSVFRR